MAKENETEKTMLELVQLYPNYRKVCDQYYSQFSSKIARFVKFCENQELKPSDVTPAHQQAFINSLNAEGKRSATVRSYYRAIVATMNFSEELKVGRVYLPKAEQGATQGFSEVELQMQLRFAKKLKGELANGVKQKHFWLASIHGAFSTGLSAGDMFRVASDDIPDDGLLDVVQRKTGKVVRVRFNEPAIKWIRKHGQPEAFPWPHTFTWFERCYAKFLGHCGVNRGTWRWIRRSAGSYADKNGNGHKLLGNTRAVFEKHYEVPAITSQAPPEQVVLK